METARLVELVEEAKHGDKNAMQTLYLDTYKSVYYFALRFVKNPEDAEDITQEVFVTVQEKISTLREPAAFYKWVNQITINQCNALLRQYKGIARMDDGDDIIAMIADDRPDSLPDKAIDDEATRKIILDVIDALPESQRMCIMMYYYSQFPIAEIAEILETNESTVKTRLSLARAKIRAALEEKEKKDGIKLYGVPLALTPILHQAMAAYAMPRGAEVRMWENISRAMSGGADGGSNSDGSDTPSGTSGQVDPKSGLGGADAATAAINSAATITNQSGGFFMKWAALSAGAKAAICVCVACVCIAAVAIPIYLVTQNNQQGGSSQAEIDRLQREIDEIRVQQGGEAGGNGATATQPGADGLPVDMPPPPSEPLHIDLTQQGITNQQLADMVASGEIPANTTTLYLGGNYISDLTPLASLPHLRYVFLWYNPVRDLAPVHGLTNLSVLYLLNTPVTLEEVERAQVTMPNTSIIHNASPYQQLPEQIPVWANGVPTGIYATLDLETWRIHNVGTPTIEQLPWAYAMPFYAILNVLAEETEFVPAGTHVPEIGEAGGHFTEDMTRFTINGNSTLMHYRYAYQKTNPGSFARNFELSLYFDEADVIFHLNW